MTNTALTLFLSAAIMTGLATQSIAAGDQRGCPRINFEEVDRNADGLLTAEELQAHREARFKQTDTDGNGVLSRAEIEARMLANQDERRVKFLDRMFDRRDANADGQLSLDEMVSGQTGKMFDRADANGDGQISKAEFDAAREAGRGHKSKSE
ncbi:MAG: EF-hand domain-containing protein [Pseudomonadota bacterium]